MKRRWSLILPLVFIVWNALSVLVLTYFGSHLPVVATNILSVAFVPFLLLMPLLKPLGLVTGSGWMNLPTTTGYILGLALYALILFVVGRFIQRR